MKSEANDLKTVLNVAYKLLSYRHRSKQELKKRLLLKGFDFQVVEAALHKLEANNYLDDSSFTRMWIEYRLKFKPCGQKLLWYELKEKGISDEIIFRELSERLTYEKEYELMQSEIKKRFGQNKEYDKKELRRINNFLERRGFKHGLIKKIIQKLNKQER